MGKITYSNGTTPTICIVGAGFSGLTAGIKLKTELNLTSFTIFDENEDVGGTWIVNTYPGCACDVQSHLYSLSIEQNPNWSHIYSPREEIWEYMRTLSRKYDLYANIRLHSQIKALTWDETIRKWRVEVLNKETNETRNYLFDIVLNGPGALRIPNIPQEFQSFEGPILHTGKWDSSVDLKNKIIAVVGSGSSGIQVIPELADRASELHCYQRKPAWVMPRHQRKIPDFFKWLLANVPFMMLFFRWFIFWFHEIFYSAFVYGTVLNRLLGFVASAHLKKQIPNDEELREKLTPNYTIGCKRIIVSNEYYPTFKLPHVFLHREKIMKISGNKIITEDGSSQTIDVLVLATGFTVHDYFAPMKITGTKSEDILTSWKTIGPRGYLGIAASNTPNQFGIIGPNTGLGHNTVLFMLECQVNHIVQLIAEMMRRDAKVLVPTLKAEEQFAKSIEKQMQKMVWTRGNCAAWYANDKGIVTTLWPYSCINYWLKTRRPDFAKYDFS